ncbi:MAG: hypothetical protein A2X37_10090 [Elusimicrobia bacterium GWA2_66_18]|nr:MAG: hypothetical protein A2X37_10090 [Elusimicrobia bacterium GWA2_66_18]
MQRHHLEALTLPLPSPEEQSTIASILCKIRAATEKQKRITATLRELREAMMASLFAKRASKRTGSDTPAQYDPATWKMTCLGKVAKIARGKFSHRPRNEPRFYGGKIPFIQTGDVARSNGRIRSYSQTLNESGLAISKLFPKGTIVLTIAANIGETGILEFDSAFPDSLVGITPDETVDPVFLEYYLRTQKAEMNRLAPKGTQKNINLQFLMPWPVPLPPPADQKRIARDLRLIDNRLEFSMEKARLLEVLFQSTLEFLMTAPIRILGGSLTAMAPVEK